MTPWSLSKSRLRSTAVASALAALSTCGPAFADVSEGGQRPVSEVLARIPELTPLGQRPRMDLYASPASDLVWAFDPDTGMIIAGYAFDDAGVSFGKSGTILEGLTLDDFIGAKVGLAGPGEVSTAHHEVVMETLDGLDIQDRDAALEDLARRLRDVTGEAEFDAAASAWIESLAEREHGAVSLAQALDSSAAIHAGDGTGLKVGVLTDPMCLPCSDAVAAAIDLAEQGLLDLRITLAPLTSDDAHGVVAGVLSAEDSLTALLSLGDPAMPVPFAPYAHLPAEMHDAAWFNRGIASSNVIREIPLFTYKVGDVDVYTTDLSDVEAHARSAIAP